MRAAALRAEGRRLLLWAVLEAAVVWVVGALLASFSARPWAVLAVLVPLTVAAIVLGRSLPRDRRLLLGGGFLLFFLAYYGLFAVAAVTHLLDGQRAVVTGYEAEAPSNTFGLNRLGDWRYLFARRAPTAHDMVVVLLPSFEGRPVDEARLTFADLVQKAVDVNARGIAFDYALEDTSRIDRILCFRIERSAAPAGVPVTFGYRLESRGGLLVRPPLPPGLRSCLTDDRLASLAGVREADGRVRLVPLSRPGDAASPSLAYRVARGLAGSAARLDSAGLLRYVPTARPIATLEGVPAGDDLDLLRDRFILAGSFRPGDTHDTPFGLLPGVMIHAYAANGLRTGHFIRAAGSGWTLAVLLVVCYALVLLQARGKGPRALAIGAALLIVAVLAGAAVAMAVGLVWVDVAYPITAAIVLTILLIGGARLQQGRQLARSPAALRVEAGGARSAVSPGVPAAAGGTAAAGGSARGTVAAGAGSGAHRGVAGDADGSANAGADGSANDGADGGAIVPAGAVATEPFDVFLSHNSRDDATVVQLAGALRGRRLRVWLDSWELVPGRPWQEALEEVIRTVRSAAILVGGDGLGPWELPEMRACLEECVRRRMPVIPVLLPGAPEKPELPLFLTAFTWVDLRGGLKGGGLDRLEWGITGVKPRKSA